MLQRNTAEHVINSGIVGYYSFENKMNVVVDKHVFPHSHFSQFQRNNHMPIITIFTQNVKLHNRFDIEVVDATSGEIKQRAYAENIILNQFWNTYLGTGFFNYIHMGSGTSTLVATRTSLFTFVVAKAVDATWNTKDMSVGYGSYRRRTTLIETDVDRHTSATRKRQNKVSLESENKHNLTPTVTIKEQETAQSSIDRQRKSRI